MAQQSKKVQLKVAIHINYFSPDAVMDLWFDESKPTWNGLEYENEITESFRDNDLFDIEGIVHGELYQRKGADWILIEIEGKPVSNS